MIARPEGKFDAILNLQERNGFGEGIWQGLISTFSGIGYQTIYPEYHNIGGSAMNVTSLVRWDAQKRRLTTALSGPLHGNPRWRYRLGFDLRNENSGHSRIVHRAVSFTGLNESAARARRGRRLSRLTAVAGAGRQEQSFRIATTAAWLQVRGYRRACCLKARS